MQFVFCTQAFRLQAFEHPLKCSADPNMYQFGVMACDLIANLLARGELRPGPVKLFPYGLASVKEGLQYMHKGQVSLVMAQLNLKLKFALGQRRKTHLPDS